MCELDSILETTELIRNYAEGILDEIETITARLNEEQTCSNIFLEEVVTYRHEA